MEITNIHKSLAKELIRCINEDGEKALITYGEMCSRANNIIDPRGSSGYIGDLSEICYENSMPLISVMVVNANTYSPGGGFFKLYTQLTGKKVEDKNSLFKEELKKVREYDNWERLIELLEEINPKSKLILPEPKFEVLKINPKKKKILSRDELEVNVLKNTEVEFEEINEFINIDEVEIEEGEYVERFIKTKRRNANARKLKLRQFKQDNNGQVFCEVCKEDDIAVIDIHHNFIEVAKMEGVHKTKLSDLRVLCSNCHRKVHYYEKDVDNLIEEYDK